MQAEETLAAADWLRAPALQAVFDALEREGDHARVVGGAVRNTLLGHAVPDVDIATTARPQTVMERARAAGMKPVGTGIDHGTVTVISGGVPFEVTTLREDVETFGRQARVSFGLDWSRDAARRDFTMNALYADRQGRLHDPLGGLADCLARRVRFIGDADQRIREDYLRILRFFRFHASYGAGDIDRDGLGACLRQRDGLRQLSAERIGHEIRRLLRAPGAAAAVGLMNDCGLWEIATGGVAQVADFTALRDLPVAGEEVSAPELALVVLSGFVEEDLDRLADRLRLSNAERERMRAAFLARSALAGAGAFPGAAAQVYGHGRQGAIDGLLAHWARLSAQGKVDSAGVSGLLEQLHVVPMPVFPLKGAELIARGHAPGPALGALLKRLEAEWRRSGFALGSDELLELAGRPPA